MCVVKPWQIHSNAARKERVKCYNMLQHTFNKVNIVKVFTPRLFSQQFRGVMLHNPSALELRAWTEATEITPFLGPNYFFIPGGNKCYNKLPLQTSSTDSILFSLFHIVNNVIVKKLAKKHYIEAGSPVWERDIVHISFIKEKKKFHHYLIT